MTLYFFPFAIPTLLFWPVDAGFNMRVVFACVFALLVYGVWLIINYKVLRISLSKEMVVNFPIETKYRLFLKVYSSAGSAICEELFFRGFILSADAPIAILVAISSILFMLSHYTLPWGSRFTKDDHINQVTIGIINSILFIYSGSILPCIFLHLLMNLPTVLRHVRCFERYYVRKEYFEELKLSIEGNFDELDI